MCHSIFAAKITSQEVATKQAQGEIVSLQATIVSYEDEIQTQKANKLESDKMVQAVNVAKNELEMLVNSLKKDIKRVTGKFICKVREEMMTHVSI